MSDILEREQLNRPTNENELRGIEKWNSAYVYNINNIVKHLDIEKVIDYYEL